MTSNSQSGEQTFTVTTGYHSFKLTRSALLLRFNYNARMMSDEASFRLVSTEGPAFEQIMALKEDPHLEDGFVDLVFVGVYTEAKYSLEIDPGDGKPKYWSFQEQPFASLAGLTGPTGN